MKKVLGLWERVLLMLVAALVFAMSAQSAKAQGYPADVTIAVPGTTNGGANIVTWTYSNGLGNAAFYVFRPVNSILTLPAATTNTGTLTFRRIRSGVTNALSWTLAVGSNATEAIGYTTNEFYVFRNDTLQLNFGVTTNAGSLLLTGREL